LLVDLVVARCTDPHADASAVMKWADSNGFGQIVSELLDEMLDFPHEYSNPLNFLIYFASEKGRSDLVKLLLTDNRIDPSVDDQLPIRRASWQGHPEVVKLLLADKRVDPSAEDQYAIQFASENGHVEVVKLLLADQRVDIDNSPCPSPFIYPEILSLFLLRQSYRREVIEAKLHHSHPTLSFVVADIEKIESQRKALLDDHLVSDLSHLCLSYVPDFFCHLDGKISYLVGPTKFPRFSFGSLSTL
jgi:hypothetical protein